MSVSLSFDGTILAVGEPLMDDGSATFKGRVRIYEYNQGTTSWVQLGDDIIGEQNNDKSGMSVSLSGSGNTVAIGTQYNEGESGDALKGHTRIFRYTIQLKEVKAVKEVKLVFLGNS